MKNQEVKNITEKAVPILKKEGVIHSALFGSVVRGEGTTESDVDILVELPEGKTLLDLVELRIRLEEALGRKVDVLTYRSLHPLLKDRILEEQVSIL